MHELSIAQSLHDLVQRHAPPGAVVRTIKLRIGPMRGIAPDALHWGWQCAAAGSPLDGSVLDLEMLPWSLHCPACDRRWTSDDLFSPCACGHNRPRPAGGDELQILSLTVDEP